MASGITTSSSLSQIRSRREFMPPSCVSLLSAMHKLVSPRHLPPPLVVDGLTFSSVTAFEQFEPALAAAMPARFHFGLIEASQHGP